MLLKRSFGIALGLAGLFAATSAPLWGQGSALAMLDGLQKGRWELRVRGEDGNVEKICLGNGRQLIQLRHRSDNCNSVVVEDTPTQVTVQYTCPGKGYGRTRIRRETGQLAQVHTQGIVDGAPFAFSLEARWTGRCGS